MAAYRAEIARLTESKQFDMEEGEPLGLAKVANRKVVTGGKAKEPAEATPAAAEGEQPAEPAAE